MTMTHTDSIRARNKGLWYLGFGALLATLSACGSRLSGGNTGSETHWLQSCDSDAECGIYSCLCGVCSRSCDDGEECDGASDGASRCEATSELSCSGETPAQICVKAATTTTTSPNEICDGGDDFRWVFYEQPSFFLASSDSRYRTYYGEQFLAIDGKCNFWGSKGGVMVSGKITDPQLLEDYESTQYDQLNRFGDAPLAPPDSPISVVWDPSGAIHGYPQAGAEGVEAEYFDALAQAQQLVDALMALGEHTNGPRRAVFLPLEEGATGLSPWPLDLDPTTVIRGPGDWSGGLVEAYTGVLFEAGARADALRSGNFHYSGTEEVDFQVVVRDEPPTRVGAFVLSVVDRELKRAELPGGACESDAQCGDSRMGCQENQSGETQCNTCIGTQDSEWLCDSNDDCCGTAVCCVDCGEDSGKCITDPDPCSVCLASGSSWVDYRTCNGNECAPDSTCFADECPGQCAEDNCGGCGQADDCWAAGCEWQLVSESSFCGPKPEVVETQDVPCSIDATSVDVPGASVHLEADTCSFLPGDGGQFRYTVTLDQTVDFTSESSGGACGLCGVTTDPETWVTFVIQGSDASYCPECDVGCCAPTEEAPVTIDEQSIEGTVDWPGLQWNGPSDTGNEPAGAFAPGSYAAKLTLRLPGLGEVQAVLPIEVVEPR